MQQHAQQYITNGRGEKIGAVLDIKTYRKMIDALDEYQSIKEYRSAKMKTDKEISCGEFVTLSEFKSKIAKKKSSRFQK